MLSLLYQIQLTQLRCLKSHYHRRKYNNLNFSLISQDIALPILLRFRLQNYKRLLKASRNFIMLFQFEVSFFINWCAFRWIIPPSRASDYYWFYAGNYVRLKVSILQVNGRVNLSTSLPITVSEKSNWYDFDLAKSFKVSTRYITIETNTFRQRLVF